MKKLAVSAFVVVAIVQWMIPANMIWEKNKTLVRGEVFKFATAPVDPTHPFIGKYVHLDFNEAHSSFPAAGDYKSGETIYVVYKKDKKGYAQVAGISRTKPSTHNYLQAKVNYINSINNEQTLFFQLPFNRFYMEEYKAPRAEKLYLERSPDTTNKTYALVSLFDGDAVIKDVFINDTSISTLLKVREEPRKD
jgi:uncharacterized membrane-anchored protein